jgi:hypothetical protein
VPQNPSEPRVGLAQDRHRTDCVCCSSRRMHPGGRRLPVGRRSARSPATNCTPAQCCRSHPRGPRRPLAIMSAATRMGIRGARRLTSRRIGAQPPPFRPVHHLTFVLPRIPPRASEIIPTTGQQDKRTPS